MVYNGYWKGDFSNAFFSQKNEIRDKMRVNEDLSETKHGMKPISTRLPVPDMMNFRKTSERGGGHIQSKKCCCVFLGIAPIRKV